MKILVIVAIWLVTVVVLILFYRGVLTQILSLNKGLIEAIDFLLTDIIKKIFSNLQKIVDFQKTVEILEEERKKLYEPPYNLASLEKWWELALAQHDFVRKLLKEEETIQQQKIYQLLKILTSLCKVKKFLEGILIILTLGLFLWFKKRIVPGVYVYC